MDEPQESAASPVAAGAILRWMAEHGARLRELVAEEEAQGHPTGLPADDGCIRANLRLLAEALAGVAEPTLAARLAGFGEGLDAWFDQEREELEAHLDRAEGAIALEEHLQFGISPGQDPSIDAGLERRLRLTGWLRLCLHGLEAHLGPVADGLADATLRWMGERQRELARLVLTLDAHMRAGWTAANPGRSPGVQTLDEMGQTAVVRAHVRHLAEALEVTLAQLG